MDRSMTAASTHDTIELPIGADVVCQDGAGGNLTQVVIDPIAERVTHVVVETKGGRPPRLVPIDLLDVVLRQVRLHCTNAELHALPAAEEAEYLPVVSGGAGLGYGPGSSFIWPYYGIVGTSIGGGMGTGLNQDIPVVHDRLPLGEVAVRRNQCVSATDGDIGQVKGLVLDPADHHVTHFLLKEGHLWDRKEVAIPIGTVTSVTDGIKLSLDRDEIGRLPSLVVSHPEWE
jgi:sporulation protein YlmC with PRC-barrel domain